jgi:hypothetical protein
MNNLFIDILMFSKAIPVASGSVSEDSSGVPRSKE